MAINARHVGGDILGVGLALSISTLTQFLLLLVLIYKKYGAIDGRLIFKSQLKVATAAGIMGFWLWLLMRVLDRLVFDTTRTIPLIGLTVVVAVIGLGVFLGLTALMRSPELTAYTGILKKLGKWRSILAESDEVLESTSQTEEVKPW
jgi:putative peptidoglycan lipid II flippase